PSYGTAVVGYIDLHATCHAEDDGHSLLGDLSRIHELCSDLRIERVIVAFSSHEDEDLLDAVRAGNALGVKVTIVPRLFEVLGGTAIIDDVEGMSMLSLGPSSRTRLSLALKRTIDVI